MNKSFVVLVFLLVLFPSHQPAHQVLGQAAAPKHQPLRTTTIQTNPAVPASRDPSSASRSLYEEGVKRVEAGQVSEAVERFQRAITLDPEYAEAYSALGRAFFKLRQFENASGNLRRAIALRAKQRETQDPLKNLKRDPPSTTPPGSKPPTPNKSTTDAQTPRVISLTTSPPTKPAPQANTSTRASTFNAKTTTAQLRRVEPSTTTKTEHSPKLSPAAVSGNAALKTPATPSDRVQPIELRRADGIAKGPDLIIANTVQLASLPRVAPLKLIPPAPKAVQLSVTREPQLTQLNSDEGDALAVKQQPANLPMAMSVTLSVFAEAKRVVPVSPKRSTYEVSLTNIYRVGPKDVLDVSLNNSQTAQTTTFMVPPSGLLELPTLSEPLPVMGLTVEEITARLENHLKTRALMENPKVYVGVVDYASHTVVVSGLVKDPGTKVLKREAIPLLVVLAEAQPLPHAGRVTVVRKNQTQILEPALDKTDMKFLVQPGDVITVHANSVEFVYVDGQVCFPGEKRYRHGFTLTQAIITAGGKPTKAKAAEISRDNGRGSLVRTLVDLKAIELGEAADPVLRPGDRITVMR